MGKSGSDGRAKELIDLGDRLFRNKAGLDSLNQEISSIFYPERASFTSNLDLDANFGSQNMDSYPSLLRRELGNSMSATLRPKDQPWFHATTLNDRIDNDPDAAAYLEYMTSTIRRSIYDARSKFIRATKDGDHDFVTFGQAVISCEEAPSRDHLFFRWHHLRDCAWLENELGDVDHLHRKDTRNARSLIKMFGEKKVHEKVLTAREKEPGKMFDIRVIVMPADEYDSVDGGGKIDGKGRKLPFVAIYIDATNVKILREGALPQFIYNVPRWQMLPHSAYAFSPAAITALPDARMLQSLARILLEAGEKAVDPPMIATTEAVREVNLQAGAVSWVDMEYDERLGDALRPLEIKGDMRTGFALRQDVREMLSKAFFIDKLSLPEAGKQMTAYEIRTRLEEHVRNLLPLFEPMEVEYNVGLLDRAFVHLKQMKRFDWEAMPKILSSTDINWGFKNPMQEASQRVLVEQFQEALGIEKMAMEAGVRTPRLKIADARDDALRGSGGPARWRKTNEEVGAETDEAAARAKIASAGQELATGAEVAERVGGAVQSLQGAGVLPPPEAAAARTQPGNVRPAKGQQKAPPMLRQVA